MDQDPLAQRLAAGLARVAVAVRAAGDADSAGIERTFAQQQVLLLLGQREEVCPLTVLAEELGVTRQAARDAISTLWREGLVSVDGSPDELRVELTAKGRARAPAGVNWAAELLGEMHRLEPVEQRQLLTVVTGSISNLQQRGQIPVSQMCMTCWFFDGYAHPGSSLPHHCRYVDAPFGWNDVRLRCPEQQPRAQA